MQRVFFVISSMVANGAERVMSLLVNYGAKNNMKVALALLSSEQISYELDDRVELFFLCNDLPKNRVKAMATRLHKLRQCIRDFQPDVVVSFLTTCNIYACVASVGLKIPVIISERNDPVLDCPNLVRRKIRNLSYRLAEGFVFQTVQARDYFKDIVGNRATVIPNPVKTGLPMADLDNRKKSIVAAGRLTKQKNYPMMLDAFSLFHKKHPDYILQIYGAGEDELLLKEYTISLGLSENVQFMGLVSNLHSQITDAGMYVLSSDYEGMSNSLLECLSMGMPCISTDCPCGGSSYLIEDGVNGLLVPVGKTQKMAEAMCRIAESDELAERLGKNAKKTRKKCSADTIISRYFEYFGSIADASV